MPASECVCCPTRDALGFAEGGGGRPGAAGERAPPFDDWSNAASTPSPVPPAGERVDAAPRPPFPTSETAAGERTPPTDTRSCLSILPVPLPAGERVGGVPPPPPPCGRFLEPLAPFPSPKTVRAGGRLPAADSRSCLSIAPRGAPSPAAALWRGGGASGAGAAFVKRLSVKRLEPLSVAGAALGWRSICMAWSPRRRRSCLPGVGLGFGKGKFINLQTRPLLANERNQTTRKGTSP
jgi:hypothetical protein